MAPVSYTHLAPSETDFDINYWISFAKGYAQSVGLLLDIEAVYCWDNPVSYTHLDVYKRQGVDFNEIHSDEEAKAVAREHHIEFEERHKKGDILSRCV